MTSVSANRSEKMRQHRSASSEVREIPMKLKIVERRDVSIIHLSGKLTLGEGTGTLRRAIRELVNRGSRRILLNMADVTYIDSAGIGELVVAQTTATGTGGEMKLLNLTKRVHDLLAITRLCTAFEVFEDGGSAIGSFSSSTLTDLQVRYASFKGHLTNSSARAEQSTSRDITPHRLSELQDEIKG
jgi:anti-sigma B factor antagonist